MTFSFLGTPAWADLVVLLQDAAGGEGGATATGQDGGFTIMPMLLMFGMMYLVFYFLMIRPQKRQQQEHARLLQDLKKDDRVQTSGGFFGVVDSIDRDNDQVVLRIDDKKDVRLRIARSSIVSIQGQTQDAPAATAESG